MRLSQVDLNLFLVFDTIYAERNLTKAAEVLCITQPAVSNALNRLRKTFDDQLFVRSPQGMIPTPVAHNIIVRVRKALQLLNSSVLESEIFTPEQSTRQITCSMNDLAESLILPQLIGKLQKSAPGVSLNSYYLSREEVAKELSSGTLDFAIDVPFISDKNLCHYPLADEEYVCVVRNAHPIIKDALNLDQYLSLSHLNVSSRRKGEGPVDIALSSQGYQRNIKVRVKHYMAATRVIEKTDLLWTLPKRLADQLKLKSLTLPFEMMSLEWHLFWHKSADKDQANIWMRKLFLGITKL